MSEPKTAACKFISSRTIVVPKPGKFPDVDNAPIKSDTSGTDNIEDQKYQEDEEKDEEKDAAALMHKAASELSRLLTESGVLAAGHAAMPAAGAGIGALINLLRGKSIGRGAGVGALTGLGANVGGAAGLPIGVAAGGLLNEADSDGYLSLHAPNPYVSGGRATGIGAGAGLGAYGGYQLGQAAFGPEKSEKEDEEKDAAVNFGRKVAALVVSR